LEVGPVRDAMLALLVKEPAHGYELRQRLVRALGAAGALLNPGQVYVTLTRLDRAGLVKAEAVEQASHPDKKVYEATAAGRERVARWLADLSWPKVAPVEFHLKLVAAAVTGMADPVALVDAQRRELLRELREVERLAAGEPDGGDGRLLLEGTALRLQADIRWLEACERHWTTRRGSR
jgi:DNA-binding PadR family transcriptional regulator